MNQYYVYILTNKNNTTLSVGVTNDLERRMYEHKTKIVKGFTEKYNLNKLVCFEETNDIHQAIAREKKLKKWRRKWKEELIREQNLYWKDLSADWNVTETRDAGLNLA